MRDAQIKHENGTMKMYDGNLLIAEGYEECKEAASRFGYPCPLCGEKMVSGECPPCSEVFGPTGGGIGRGQNDMPQAWLK